jgi:hypothetical protein
MNILSELNKINKSIERLYKLAPFTDEHSNDYQVLLERKLSLLHRKNQLLDSLS